jgi:hypothetical protein
MARARSPFDKPPFCPAALADAQARGADRFVAPTAKDRRALHDAVACLVGDGAAGLEAARATAATASYGLTDLAEWPGAVLLHESPGARRGGGAYVISLRPRAPRFFVQAPHTLFEAGTLALACALFASSGAAGLFVDTAHRYRAAAPDAEGEHPADAAHNAASLFQAATEGLLEASPAATVLQLHGFSERAGGVTVIVSAGISAPGDARVAKVASALRALLGPGVRRYPDDTADLGATSNVQGIAVRHAHGQFLHVEIDATLRRTLLADGGLRARVLDAVGEAVAE